MYQAAVLCLLNLKLASLTAASDAGEVGAPETPIEVQLPLPDFRSLRVDASAAEELKLILLPQSVKIKISKRGVIIMDNLIGTSVFESQFQRGNEVKLTT